MAGCGVALRLHDFKEFLHCEHLERQNRAWRQGRDTRGLYPGQLGRVHPAHPRHHGDDIQSRRLFSAAPNELSNQNFTSSFDVQTLRAVSVRFRPEERPLHTTYQEHFGLQSNLHL